MYILLLIPFALVVGVIMGRSWAKGVKTIFTQQEYIGKQNTEITQLKSEVERLKSALEIRSQQIKWELRGESRNIIEPLQREVDEALKSGEER